MTTTLSARDLLWFTRGARWDYDVILAPQTFRRTAWGDVVQDLAHHDTDGQIVGHVFDDAGARREFVGFVGIDGTRRDARGSQIRQLVLWFPPGGDASGISEDWWRQLRDVADAALSSAGVHDLTDAALDAVAASKRSVGEVVGPLVAAGILEFPVDRVTAHPNREDVGPIPKAGAPAPIGRERARNQGGMGRGGGVALAVSLAILAVLVATLWLRGR